MNMKTNHIENCRKVGGDYFSLNYVRKSNKTLQYYLNQFNIEDYNIIKATRNQKLVSIEDFMKFEYACYTFFNKDIYDINYILYWIDYIIGISGIMFLDKPLPPFNPYNKIKIKEKL